MDKRVKLRDKPPKQGRPIKITTDIKIDIYTLHLSGFWIWQIVKGIQEKHDIEISEISVKQAIRWMRKSLPIAGKKENLMEAIHACEQRVQELTEKSGIFAKRNQNAYLGCMREIRENHELKLRLQGLLEAWKMTMDMGEETKKDLAAIMEGKWKPKLPEDLPPAARQAITGEGVEDE